MRRFPLAEGAGQVLKRFAGKRFLPELLLFGFPAALALTALPVGFWHFSYMALYYSQEVRYLDFLAHPIYHSSYYRPLGYLWSKWFYGLFGLNPMPYHLFTAATMGLFGVVLYRFFLHVAPEKRRTAFAAAALTTVSPPVWYVLLLRFDPEVLQDIFLYLILLAFLSLPGKDPRRGRLLLLAAVPLAFLGGLTRENIRGMLPAMLVATSVVLWLEKRLTRRHFLASVLCIAAVGVTISIQVLGSQRVPFSPPGLDAGWAIFFLMHNSLQILVPLSFTSAVVLALTHLKRRRGYIGVPLMGAAFALPPLAFVNYEEAVLFPLWQTILLAVLFGVPMLAALLAWFFRGTSVRRLLAANVLAVYSITALASLFVPYARGDTSTRTFTIVLPLMAWLLIDCLSELWGHRSAAGASLGGRTANPTSARPRPLERKLLRLIVVLCVAALLYTTAAAVYNMTSLKAAQSAAETEAISQFRGLNLTGTEVLSIDSHFLPQEALALLTGIQHPVHPVSPSFSGADIAGVAQYVYISRFKPILPLDSPARPILRGDFSVQSHLSNWQALWYGPEPTPLERWVTEKGTRVISAAREFVQVPRFLEETPMNQWSGVPWLVEYEWNVSVYRIPPSGSRLPVPAPQQEARAVVH